MTRKLKALGLAIAAVFAFSAIAASSASAQQGVLTSDGPVTLTATETGGATDNALTSFGGRTECPGSTYTGHKVLSHLETTEGKEHTLIPSGSNAATITPHYHQENQNCKATDEGGTVRPATVHTNGCDYVFRIGETTGPPAEHTYGVEADVVCPEGEHIQVTVFAQGNESHSALARVCTVTVGPQNGLKGAHITVDTTHDIAVVGKFTGIKATQSGLCGHKETEEAEFDIDVTVTGHNAEGKPTGITVTH